MSRVLLLAALLAGCSWPLSPDTPIPLGTPIGTHGDGPEGYAEALEAGDADTALALLQDAAAHGDLDALGWLSDAYGRGYLQAGWREGGSVHLPIRTMPWSGPITQARYVDTVRRRADAGDADALFRLADGYLVRQHIDGEWRYPTGGLDSARAIYDRLDARVDDDQRLRLAFLAQRLDDDGAYRAHLDAAADAGDPQACVFRFWAESRDTPPGAAVTVAAEIDVTEACRARALASGFAESAPLFDYSGRVLASLREQARIGNPAATTTLDSLHALGVFDRHAHLAVPADPLGS
ncbi:hypothetical protein [Rubrivirga sp. IMCC45206]|uniref:hypothetical protein n=1 Tax=Rubrivirga sp. IMCC45206 TaxID=3391614 RepID=UPI0039900DAF